MGTEQVGQGSPVETFSRSPWRGKAAPRIVGELIGDDWWWPFFSHMVTGSNLYSL